MTKENNVSDMTSKIASLLSLSVASYRDGHPEDGFQLYIHAMDELSTAQETANADFVPVLREALAAVMAEEASEDDGYVASEEASEEIELSSNGIFSEGEDIDELVTSLEDGETVEPTVAAVTYEDRVKRMQENLASFACVLEAIKAA